MYTIIRLPSELFSKLNSRFEVYQQKKKKKAKYMYLIKLTSLSDVRVRQNKHQNRRMKKGYFQADLRRI